MTSFFMSELNKLKNIQLSLEKNDNLLKILLKFDDGFNLLEYYTDLEHKRKTETDRTNNELKDILSGLEETKKLVKTQDINKLDLKCFKKGMIELQEKIQTLKMRLKINLEALKEDEKDLFERLEIHNQKLLEWEKPVAKSATALNIIRISSHIKTAFNNDKDVREFMDFVNKSGGHENGWSTEDHSLFCKLRKKQKNAEKLAENLHKLLPDITEEDVMRHETWYRKYLLLKDKKRDAVNKWRETRTKNENLPKIENADDKNVNVAKVTYLRPNGENIQEKLDAWKAEKEARRFRQLEFETINKKRLKKIQEDKQRMNEEVKKSVDKWRQAKIIKEENEKVQKEILEYKEKKIKAAEANRMIKQFRSQDDLFIMRMRSGKQKERREVKRSKSSHVVSVRDPERIFKPTKQWLMRTVKKDNFLGQLPSCVPNIAVIPRLRVPDWRKIHH